VTEIDPSIDIQPDAATEFQAGRVATIAGGHAVHDAFPAFLPPLLPRFVESLSLTNTAAGGLFGLSTAMVVAAAAIFLDLPLIWMVTSPVAGQSDTRGSLGFG
jgi:hypothetical protein